MLTGRRAWGGDSAGAVAVARLTGDPPLASSVEPGVPEVLDIAVMRALAREPGERPTASDMAALLDRYAVDPAGAAAWVSSAPAFAATASTGALNGNALAAASTVAAAGASGPAGAGPPPGGAGYYSSPPPFDPTSDRYSGGPAYGTVRGGASPRRAPAAYVEEEPEQQSTGVWGWIAAVLGILVLFAGGLLLFLLLNRPVAAPAPSGTAALITLPSFVGQTLEDAQQDAEDLGLIMAVGSFQVSTDVEENTVIAQDPVAGGLVARGSRVVVTVAAPSSTTLVPEVRLRTEPETFAILAQAGLMPGLRSTEFDLTVPPNLVIRTNPRAGVEVRLGTAIDYVVSLGPQPTLPPPITPSPLITLPPTPTPTIEVTPTPSPTPSPTPVPPPITAPPPTPVTVGNWAVTCATLGQARAEIVGAGLVVGIIQGPGYPSPPPSPFEDSGWQVVGQFPAPGTPVMPGTPIDLTVVSPVDPCPSPPPP